MLNIINKFLFILIVSGAAYADSVTAPQNLEHLKKITLAPRDSSFKYSTVGFFSMDGLALPTIGMGYRHKFGSGATDFSSSFTTLLIGSGINVNCSGLYYLNSDKYYVGAGLEGKILLIHFSETFGSFCLINPNVSFGYENKRRFHQLNIGFIPVNKNRFEPVFSYKYGIKF